MPGFSFRSSWRLVVLLCASVASFAQEPSTAPRPTRDTYLKLEAEVEAALHNDVLDSVVSALGRSRQGWIPLAFRARLESAPGDGKFSVFQARLTWLSSQIVLRRPELKDRFLPIARHGLAYLSDTLWDRQNGGFFWGLDEDGKISAEYTDGKHLYGNSFCLYALAAAYQATGDPSGAGVREARVPLDRRARARRAGTAATSNGCRATASRRPQRAPRPASRHGAGSAFPSATSR